jgi:acetylornithine deacetylase/succinyl-diaminopimelate desuccinylase-like protein
MAVAAVPAAATPPFSGARAMELLVELCDLGPRVPGTEAHAQARAYVRDHLAENGATVEIMEFEAQLPRFEHPVRLSNIIGRFAPDRSDRVLIGAHWDSRPWADQDPDSTRHREPVLGANDSASGCAVLLALAETLASEPAAYGVDLVFFDGEDAGVSGDLRSYCLGSQEYVRRMAAPPVFVIILDMVGDRDLTLHPERYGLQMAPQLQRYVWERARLLGIRQCVDAPVVDVFDDHVPFLEAGVPAIDLIDFDYTYWHTVEDTPDKCSAASLQVVGELVSSLIFAP